MDTFDVPRTVEEAIRDLDYVCRLSQRHRRFYNRLHGLLRFLELLGGSAAVGVAFSGSPTGIKIAGVLVAIVAYTNFAFDPGARAKEHDHCGNQYAALRASVSGMTMEQIDERRLAIAEPDYFETLRMPSWNDMMRRHGFVSSAQPLSWRQRIMSVLA